MLFNREHNLETAPKGSDVSTVSLTERYLLDCSHRVILYAGTFEPYQGLDLLVNASRTVVHSRTNVRFLCLGGNQNQVAAIRARVQERGVGQYFVLPGTVPPEEVEQHFRIASVLVSPRISGTNTPLKIYSYLRSEVPIVATNIPSHTQVLTAEVALLVEPRAESLAAGILRLLDDAKLARHLVQNALRLVHKSYSPEVYYGKVAEVFSFLAARTRARNQQF